ncbi:MAG TPA: DUF4258 domain-containing protein [bacterium]
MNADLTVHNATLGLTVRIAAAQWERIVAIKHPVLTGREAEVIAAIESPDEIRRSRHASDVVLCYKLERPGRWICAVVKRLQSDGFLITAYITDAIKEGTRIWPR